MLEITSYHARFTQLLEDGPRESGTNDELVAVELAVQAAMLAHPAQRIVEAVEREIRKMEQSLASVRRAPGDVVALPSRGLQGAWRIADPTSFGCPQCGNTACREWATLVQVDGQNRPTGEQTYHVSECCMDAVGVSEQT